MAVRIDLSGKVALVLGVANERSIAWAISQRLSEAGCQIILAYQNERLREGVERLSRLINCSLTIQCDAKSNEEIVGLFEAIKGKIGFLDFLIHSIAFAREIKSNFLEISREAFLEAIDVSAYSLIPLSREFAKIARLDGSIVTLTFQASEKVIPIYGIMSPVKACLENIVKYIAFELGQKVRVNAVSAGPIASWSSRAFPNFALVRSDWLRKTPQKQDVNQEDVADAVLFLCGPLSRRITGEIIHVDSGYHIMGP